MSRTEQTLIEARALVARPYGWIKGRSKGILNGSPAFCASGACLEAAGVTTDDGRRTYELAMGYLDRVVRTPEGPCDNIIDFNDRISTKKVALLAVFDKAIELAHREDPA